MSNGRISSLTDIDSIAASKEFAILSTTMFFHYCENSLTTWNYEVAKRWKHQPNNQRKLKLWQRSWNTCWWLHKMVVLTFSDSIKFVLSCKQKLLQFSKLNFRVVVEYFNCIRWANLLFVLLRMIWMLPYSVKYSQALSVQQVYLGFWTKWQTFGGTDTGTHILPKLTKNTVLWQCYMTPNLLSLTI